MIKQLLLTPRAAWRDQRVRYLIIGGWNTLFGYLIGAALYYLLSTHIALLLIQLAATIVANTNAFIGYKWFVFRTRGNLLKEYLRFYAVYAIPTLLGIAAVNVLVKHLHWNFYAVTASVTAFTVVVSYVGHKTVTFRQQR